MPLENSADRRGFWAMVPVLVRRAVRFEAGVWRSLGRWLVRRPDVAPGEKAFAYRGPVVALLLMFILLSAVEAVAVDLILPWRGAIRIVLLVLGIWGTMLMLGILASITVFPHVVRPSGLRVRYGLSLDVQLPWDVVTSVQRVTRIHAGQGTVQLDGETLNVVMAGQTAVKVELARPVHVDLPRERTAEITTLHFHTDDAAGLVAAARAHLEARPTGQGA